MDFGVHLFFISAYLENNLSSFDPYFFFLPLCWLWESCISSGYVSFETPSLPLLYRSRFHLPAVSNPVRPQDAMMRSVFQRRNLRLARFRRRRVCTIFSLGPWCGLLKRGRCECAQRYEPDILGMIVSYRLWFLATGGCIFGPTVVLGWVSAESVEPPSLPDDAVFMWRWRWCDWVSWAGG